VTVEHNNKRKLQTQFFIYGNGMMNKHSKIDWFTRIWNRYVT